MGSDSMCDDFDTLDIDSYICDIVVYGPKQRMQLSETWSTQEWDKFDKALAKKSVDPTLINQAKSCGESSTMSAVFPENCILLCFM